MCRVICGTNSFSGHGSRQALQNYEWCQQSQAMTSVHRMKLNSDKLLRHYSATFFKVARAAVSNNPDEIGTGGIRFIKGIVFIVGHDLQKAEYNLINRCIRLLGSKAGNEKELTSLAWEQVWNSLAGENPASNIDSIVTSFIRALTQHVQLTFEYIIPNYVIHFSKGVCSIRIGAVQAILSEDIATLIDQHKAGKKLKLYVGSEYFMLDQNMVWFVQRAD